MQFNIISFTTTVLVSSTYYASIVVAFLNHNTIHSITRTNEIAITSRSIHNRNDLLQVQYRSHLKHEEVVVLNRNRNGRNDGLPPWCIKRNNEIFKLRMNSSASSSSFSSSSPLSNDGVDFSSSPDTDTSTLLNEIKQMRVREIKKELDEARISTSDCFEKDELAQRLYDYKIQQKNHDGGDDDNSVNSSKNDDRINKGQKVSVTATKEIIRVPMEFHSLTSNSVPSNNNVYLRPSPGKFPAITVTLPTKNNKKLTLLVDTACSGLLIRPNVANILKLPSINAGMTLTAAGGSMNGSNNVCSLDCLKLTDENGTVLKDFIVLAQDIGALPQILDGIIGLSFLERYDSVSFDFDKGELVLKNSNTDKTAKIEYQNPMQYETLAETKLQRSRLGIYLAQTTLDGRGPVKMIVDSGAAATFLNWKGVGDLNMERNHPLISYNAESIGVMGADNNALALSHRFVLKRRVNFASSQGSNLGMFAPGLEIESNDNGAINCVNVDIGDLPVLQQMSTEDVGGILGNDILMRCDVVHFENLKDLSSLKVSLLRRRTGEGI